jgi:predicted permease
MLIVLALALGIGANTGVFTLVNAVLLRSLPVEKPEELYFVDMRGRGGAPGGSSYGLYRALQQNASGLGELAAFRAADLRVVIDGQPEPVSGLYASGNLHRLLGVDAIAGRMLDPADDSILGSGGPNGAVAIISYAYWQRRFGGRADIVGKTIQVGDLTTTIAGVSGRDFFGLQPGRRVDLTLPLTLAPIRPLQNKTAAILSVVGRARPGANLEAAQTELQRVLLQWVSVEGISPAIQQRLFAQVVLTPASKGRDVVRRHLSVPLLILLASVGLVLLIACTNVASLLLVRAARRQHEFSTRLALGAGRVALMTQLLAEVLPLVLGGIVLGVPLGIAAVRLLAGMFMAGQADFFLSVPLDRSVLLFVATCATLTALLCATLPGLWVARLGPAQFLRQDHRTVPNGKGKLSRFLLAWQTAAAIVLLSSAGLLLRTLDGLYNVDKGFQESGVLLVDVEVDGRTTSEEQRRQLWASLPDQVKVLTRVSDASLSNLTPLTAGNAGAIVTVPGVVPRSELDLQVARNEVSAAYFSVMSIPLVTGRVFTASDTDRSERVAVVDEAAANAFFGGAQAALDRSFKFGTASDAPSVRIVGVVRDVTHRSLREPAPKMFYLPLAQALEDHSALTLAVRGVGAAPVREETVRTSIRQASGQIVIGPARSLAEQIDESLRQERTLTALVTGFSVIALVLTATGLYGLVWHTVAARVNEIGVRMAMGATAGRIVRLIAGDVAPVLASGLLLGLGASLVAARLLQNQLFGVSAFDPITLIGTVLLFAIFAVIACAAPLRRATRVDPIIAIKFD